jgi:hypothetical protein
MTRHRDGKLTKNDNGGHVYIGPDLLNDSTTPLTPGERVDIITIPHTAVVIAPKDSLDLPTSLNVREPTID